jgi:predicted nucleic-acid-binding protein
MPKYCLDTNYLLRYILNDIPSQADEVVQILELASEGKAVCFVSIVVQMEVFFTLSTFYDYNKNDIYKIMTNIYNMVFLDFEYAETMRIALEIYLDKSLSIQDSFLIAFSKTEKMELKTFDKKALKAFQNLS